MFSRRLPYIEGENLLYSLFKKKKSEGSRIIDLTSSNTTEEDLVADRKLLEHFANNEKFLYYKPSARGDGQARELIAELYDSHYKLKVNPDDIFLTTGTSEAYSYLFKLLTNAGESVLIPSPVYPLFEFIAQLEGIKIIRYILNFNGKRWESNFQEIQNTNDIKAVIVINPNNPTGSYINIEEKNLLTQINRERKIPLIIDEVFFDYELECDYKESFAGESKGLVFVLNGVSKLCGLPQMKLGWIILAGEEKYKAEARRRLEIIIDTYLSVSTPIMKATQGFLEAGSIIRKKIKNRIRNNYQYLKSSLKFPFQFLPVEGGWYVIIEIDEKISDEDFALKLLREKNVYVYPGYFFEFEESNKIVLSLIVREDRFQEGLSQIMDGI